jgi:hypothetical protein
MKCDLTALILYSFDALDEVEVIELANHVARCRSCRTRLTDRQQLIDAVIEVRDARANVGSYPKKCNSLRAPLDP